MPDPIRLYLDEDTINRALIKALCSRNIDVLTAKKADLIQAPDEYHLEFATLLTAPFSHSMHAILPNCIRNIFPLDNIMQVLSSLLNCQ